MRPDETHHFRHDLLAWSEPVLCDKICDAYDLYFRGNETLGKPLARQHRRVWRHILSGDSRQAAESRNDLLRLARAGRLRFEAINAIDAIVLDELVDIISMRFQGSPALTRAHSRLLIEAASSLAVLRCSAA